MAFPIKVCILCSEEFELKPNHKGFANRCPACTAPKEINVAAAERALNAKNRADNRAEFTARASALGITPEALRLRESRICAELGMLMRVINRTFAGAR